MKVSITENTARVCLETLLDWLDFIEYLDPKTRAMVIAVDELIRELKAEDWLTKKIAEDQERMRQAQTDYMARKAAAENE